MMMKSRSAYAKSRMRGMTIRISCFWYKSNSTKQFTLQKISTKKNNASSPSWKISSFPVPLKVRLLVATMMVILVLCPTYSKAVIKDLTAKDRARTIASFWSALEELETADWSTSRLRILKVVLSVGEATNPSTKLQDMARQPAVISDKRTETTSMNCSDLCQYDANYKIKM